MEREREIERTRERKSESGSKNEGHILGNILRT